MNPTDKLREEIARITIEHAFSAPPSQGLGTGYGATKLADAILSLPALNQDRLASAEKAMREIIECEPKGWMAHAQAIVAKHFATYPESKT